jgi:hypothetical protein
VIAVASSAGLIQKRPHQVPQPPPHALSGIAQVAKAFLFMARSLGFKNVGAVSGWMFSVGSTQLSDPVALALPSIMHILVYPRFSKSCAPWPR